MASKTKNDYIVVFDGGRSLVKGKTQSSEVSFTHALSEISEIEYRQMEMRDTNKDFVRVNGKPYVVGKTAIKRGYQARKTTAERYNANYYGVLLAVMLYRLYDKPVRNLLVYASHPPVAVEYRPQIIEAAKGEWVVEGVDGKRKYVVKKVHCFDEPVGGVMNLLLKTDGRNYASSGIREGNTLVMDIGGQTIDVTALENGRVDYTYIQSANGGVIEIEQAFQQTLIAQNKDKFMGTNFINPHIIRESLRTNLFNAGVYGELNVAPIVESVTGDILTRVNALIEESGGLTAYSNIVLTGGGGGLLYDRIGAYFDHAEIIKQLGRKYFHLAADLEYVHLANVRGGYKLLKMFKDRGVI